MAGAQLDTSLGDLQLQAFYGDITARPSLANVAAQADPGVYYQPHGFSLYPPGASGRAMGVSGGIGFSVLNRPGQIRLSAVTAAAAATANGPADDVTVLGANSNIKLSKQITLSAEWARSLMGTSRLGTAYTGNPDAFNAAVGFDASGLRLSAGYRYVDPEFYTPGSWGRIGAWLNPTNIQGPTFRASFDISSSLGLTVGGDYYTAARDNASLGLDANEDIARALLGVRWGLSRSVNLTADYEGVFWSLNGSRGAGSGMFHPTEHYLTLGTGYSLTGTTLLKLNYQIGDLDGHGALNYGSGTRSRFNAFVGQVSVKF